MHDLLLTSMQKLLPSLSWRWQKGEPMAKNDYVKKRKEHDQTLFDIGQELGIQQMADYVAIALHESDVLRKNGYNRESIDKFFAKLQEIADYFSKAYTQDKEADYYQEQLDRAQREIFGDDMQPFNVRYPYMKDISYKKAKKGWVD